MAVKVARVLARGIALTALFSAASAADARDMRNAPAFIPLGEDSAAPRGFVDMCAGGDVRELCSPMKSIASDPALVTRALSTAASMSARHDAKSARTSASPVASLALSATPPIETDALLKRINRYVNRRVMQQTDTRIFGVDELWRRSGVGPNARGDCEDIAIEKRMELIAEGFPPDRLAFAVVFSRASGLHTILLARTEEGDVVLDSRSPYIENWTQVGYTWLSIQTMGDAMRWRALDHAA